jgi:hypothetical protein
VIGGNTTLDSTIFKSDTARLEAKVSDVIHIQKGPLHYVYEEPY